MNLFFEYLSKNFVEFDIIRTFAVDNKFQAFRHRVVALHAEGRALPQRLFHVSCQAIEPMNKVRITAIRQTVYPDLMARFENPMSAMISCNDGFRPFSFYIEVVE